MAWHLLALLLFFTVSEGKIVPFNLAPSFLPNMSRLTVPEDRPVGAVAFWLMATDVDNDVLTYGMAGQFGDRFEVEENTGKVQVAKTLDYEENVNLPVTLLVSDKINSQVRKDVVIVVEDRNDNKPVFQNPPSSASVYENDTVGTIICTVLAEDRDTGLSGLVKYSILGIIPNTTENANLFAILDNGSIYLNGSLDYNSKSTYYQLQLQAYDGGGLLNGQHIVQRSQVIYLPINVVDVPNLAPQFIGAPFEGSVSEDAILNTEILKVVAIDGDRGINDFIYFNITNSTRPTWFTIDSVSGVINVNDTLDREDLLKEDEAVRLLVYATEAQEDVSGIRAWNSTWVTIKVADVNDNEPKFYFCQLPDCNFSPDLAIDTFEGFIEEHASSRVPVNNLDIVAYDPDKGPNGTFHLSLRGKDRDAFTVFPNKLANEGEVQVLVFNSTLVDYEISDTMEVEVVANDSMSYKTSSARVTVDLIDINDHTPTFNQSLFILEINENSEIGTVVTDSIQAIDPDTGLWGKITYQLLPESIRDVFQVDADSGVVTVKNGSLLDRERQAVHYVTLQAQDGGKQTGSTLLEIRLKDVNDNPPVVSGSYNAFVKEEVDGVNLEIQAYDNDEPGSNNSRICFEILAGPYSGNFTVGYDSGVLSNGTTLDREAIDPDLLGRIQLTVLVFDLGVPSLNTTVNVTVNVEDINDNEPVFNSSLYEFSVKERLKGVKIGVLEAWDADQTAVNNRITFTLSGVGANNFMIRASPQPGNSHGGSYWGTLSLDPEVTLDYETKPNNFSLTVQAVNTDSSGGLNPTRAVVGVEDINDEPPYIVRDSLRQVEVAENRPDFGVVTVVKAEDPDTTADVQIQLLSVTCLQDQRDVGPVCWHWFVVDANGSVSVNESSAVDYEVCDLVHLTIRAWDNATCDNYPAYSPEEILPIAIGDVNDNYPQFQPQEETFVVVPEVAPRGQQVASVKANDLDEKGTQEITFSISRVEFINKEEIVSTHQGLFSISTQRENNMHLGRITVATSLDASLKGKYQLTVQAKDKPISGESLATNYSLNLFTVDESQKVRLQFSQPASGVEADLEKIKGSLTLATRTTVYIANIADFSEKDRASRVQAKSYMDAYFVYKNGTALTLNELSMLIRGDSEEFQNLQKLGLVVIGSGEKETANKEKQLISTTVGLSVAVVLLIVIMTVALVCTRNSYRRQLNAVKAAKEANGGISGATQPGLTIPGTNLYNKEGANPVLNLPAEDLSFSESLASHDNVSLNSLDENLVGSQDGSSPRQKSDGADSGLGLGGQEEPLVMVLEGRTPRNSKPGAKPEPLQTSFTNPSLDTTDL
ncbi:cadherin-related family member 2 [Tachyglossus aculeatus]|uniref:cadherin-related family member 2 n=1 Tax=Tachyglossus aculeatus TaxID=9261 RepID=UPI0018F3F5CF|nr:cadherin-related family member 2 [Tachyglossus aculeatus]XP_038627477.1 cadherin-related family member 2 [Tachyglossus aculeatus]